MSGGITSKKYWERVEGFLSENDIDARWISKSVDPDDDRAYGSLRIVSLPDLKPGYLRAFYDVVISRRPKTDKELKETTELYMIDALDLDYYSIDEHVETKQIIHEDRKQELEKSFGVKIFG